MLPKTKMSEVLVLESDPVAGAVIARSVSLVFPDARVYCETEPAMAASLLARHEIDLFIVGLRGFDLDVLTLLGVLADQQPLRTRVLVVTPDTDSTALRAVRPLPVAGVFHSGSGDMKELQYACRVIADGAEYWSRAVRESFSGGTSDVEQSLVDRADWVLRVPPRRGLRRSESSS